MDGKRGAGSADLASEDGPAGDVTSNNALRFLTVG